MSTATVLHRQGTRIRLHDTDAAGRLYFARQFNIAHDAYEAMLDRAGFGLAALLARGRLALPIVHAAADYKRPLKVGQDVVVEIRLHRLGRSSFTLVYRLGSDGATVGHVTTVHVAVNPATGRKIMVPPRLRTALQKLRA